VIAFAHDDVYLLVYYSIDWGYKEKGTIPIGDYEKNKLPTRSRKGSELKLLSKTRMDILQEWDYTLSRIVMASQEAQKLRIVRSKRSAQIFPRKQIVKNGIRDFFLASNVLFNKGKEVVATLRKSFNNNNSKITITLCSIKTL